MVELQKIKPWHLWYVIGYIATDGYLSSDGRHINITSKDREHLYLIRKVLLLKNRIGRKTRAKGRKKEYSQLQFGDIKFYKYLKGLGLLSNKSLTLGGIDVDNNFFNDFLRGVIDGDGNISTWIHKSNRHNQWSLRIFSASPIFIEWLEGKIQGFFGIKGKLYFKKRSERKNGHYILKYGKKAAQVILQNTYYGNECISMERKFLKAQLCLQSSSKSGKLYT